MEGLEQVLQLLLRNTDPAVADFQQHTIRRAVEIDLHDTAVWRVFNGIGEQVGDRLAHQLRVADQSVSLDRRRQRNFVFLGGLLHYGDQFLA